MKNWFVFAGDTYYPCGGMYDFRCSFETEDEANSYVKQLKEKDDYDWHRVVSMNVYLKGDKN